MDFNAYDKQFWSYLDDLVDSSEIVIDRAKGSRHPKYPDFVYPVDYGYLKNTTSMDGSAIDIWVASKKEKKIDSILCTLDMFKRDSEIKILYGCTAEEKVLIYNCMNDMSMRAIVIDR